MNETFYVEFEVLCEQDGAELRVTRYAINPCDSFDNSHLTHDKAKRKTFATVKDAHKWLARHGYMERTRAKHNATGYKAVSQFPGLVNGFAIEQII